jgi:hypothetical protein
MKIGFSTKEIQADAKKRNQQMKKEIKKQNKAIKKESKKIFG